MCLYVLYLKTQLFIVSKQTSVLGHLKHLRVISCECRDDYNNPVRGNWTTNVDCGRLDENLINFALPDEPAQNMFNLGTSLLALTSSQAVEREGPFWKWFSPTVRSEMTILLTGQYKRNCIQCCLTWCISEVRWIGDLVYRVQRKQERVFFGKIKEAIWT